MTDLRSLELILFKGRITIVWLARLEKLTLISLFKKTDMPSGSSYFAITVCVTFYMKEEKAHKPCDTNHNVSSS